MGLLDRIAAAPCRLTVVAGRRFCETHRRPETECLAARIAEANAANATPAWRRNPNLTTKEIAR